MSPASSVGKITLGALATSTLAACGGGNSVNAGSGGDVTSPLGMSANMASRFLGQASLDANDVSIARVMEIGFEPWLTEQMALPLSQSHREWLIEKGFNAPDPNNVNSSGGVGTVSVAEVVHLARLIAPENGAGLD